MSDKKSLIPRIYLSVCHYSGFLCLGLCSTLFGPTLLHIIYLYDTNITGVSFGYVCASIGYFLGAVLCSLVFDRFNQEIQFFVSCALMGVSTALLPWLPHLYVYFAVVTIQFIMIGFIDASGQSYILRLWIGYRWKDPIIMGSHCIWSVGAAICSEITKVFLEELPSNTSNPYNNVSTSVDTNVTVEGFYTEIPILNEGKLSGVNKIVFPFIIIGLVILLLSFLYLGGFFVRKCMVVTDTGTSHDSSSQQQQVKTRCFYITFYSLIFLFFWFYLWCEYIPGGLMSAFVVKGLDWATTDGPRILTIYWVAHGLGLLASVPMSLCLRAVILGYINLTLMIVGYVLLVFWSHITPVLYIGMSMAGFCVGPMFGCVMLLTSEYVPVTAMLGGIAVLGASVGGMTGIPLSGYMFDNYSHMWAIYLLLIGGIMDMATFTLLYYILVRQKKLSSDEKIEAKYPEETVELKNVSS